MSIQRIVILCLLTCACNVVAGQTSLRSQVEAALDSWSSRDSTRDAISKISHNPLSVLIAISKSKHEPEVRRTHAIALLATFKEAPSEHALDQLADDSNPKYRCLALQSLAEQKSHSALPVLIRKLDDQAVCMKCADKETG
jgi:HEAT repeat protein